VQVAPILYCWVFILWSTKPQYPLEKNVVVTFCEDRSGGTIWNVVVTHMMVDGRGPHEWSHDVSMMACMYLSAMGWPLFTGDVDITATWQPRPVTIDVYCYLGTRYSRFPIWIWSNTLWARPTNTTGWQANNVGWQAHWELDLLQRVLGWVMLRIYKIPKVNA